MLHELGIFVAPSEFKFIGDAKPGVFEGYGSVFGILDSHKDVVAKGAFDATLAEHKKNGTMPGMYVEHSAYTGGDPLPVGAYTDIAPDDHGLHVKGKISALDTDHGRRVRGLMADGALKGLSIAYSVPPGGARMGKKQGEPRRTLTAVDLRSVDIVREPSNSAAQINELKTAFRAHLKAAGGPGDPADLDEEAFAGPDVEDAVESVASAIIMQDKLMSGYGYGGSSCIKDCALLMDALRSAYEALTGERVPDGLVGWTKSAHTIRDVQALLREELGLSHTKASAFAKRLFARLPRDEGSNQATAAGTKSALDEIGAAVSGFKLPTF